MSRLTVLFAFFAASTVLGAPVTEYRCVSQENGSKYRVLPEFGEIHSYTASGRHLSMIDGLSVKTRYSRTRPVKTIHGFFNEEGETVAELVEGFNPRIGQMSIQLQLLDLQDSSIFCQKGVVNRPGRN
jgi:hypothetical protein